MFCFFTFGREARRRRWRGCFGSFRGTGLGGLVKLLINDSMTFYPKKKKINDSMTEGSSNRALLLLPSSTNLQYIISFLTICLQFERIHSTYYYITHMRIINICVSKCHCACIPSRCHTLQKGHYDPILV